MNQRLKYIAHLDLDCFFVSVERIKDPSLRNKAVIVGGSPDGRGVVSSASYEARAFGVRAAMPTGQAMRLCPNAIVVHGSHGLYGEYSTRLYERMMEWAPIVERASIDEMYMDFTGCESLYGNDLPGMMKKIQTMVWDEFSLPCTIALASNKVVAKIAAGTVKPAGVIYVPHGTEPVFLAPLPVDVLSGIGKKTAPIVMKYGYKKVADIQRADPAALGSLFGANTAWIMDAANGRGSDVLVTDWERKSVSREETFSTDVRDPAELEKTLFELVEDVCSTLRRKGWMAKTLTLKLRYSDFTTFTRAATVDPTHDDQAAFKTLVELLRKNIDGRRTVRLLGAKTSNFINAEQGELDLFPKDERRENVLKAVDALRRKFGSDVIHTGSV
ncbi:MAG: DNA polymerase IV [Ignavibacteriales bacterium]|nr:DNA polymerase IV [Ignavibacteriales bacterium]